MEAFILILELAGTMAFSASGAMTGLKKNMDLFGVCILGLTTAVGGGVIRDIILGSTPPATFQNPIYATVALVTALVLFLPRLRHLLMRDPVLYDLSLLLLPDPSYLSSLGYKDNPSLTFSPPDPARIP